MIEFLINHFVDDFRKRGVSFVACAVFYKLVSDVRLTFSRKRFCEVQESFAVFQIVFHIYLRENY